MDALHDKPADRVAVRVIKRGNEHVPSKKVQVREYDVKPAGVPLRTKPIWSGFSWEQPPENMLGRKVGHMVVVEYGGRQQPKTITQARPSGAIAQKWICRCPCGRYTTRTAKTIKKAKDPDDKCEHCRHLDFLRRRDRQRQGLEA